MCINGRKSSPEFTEKIDIKLCEKVSGDDEDCLAEISKIYPRNTGRFATFFPFGFWFEFRELFKLALPIMLTSLAINTITVVSIIFCGHLGKTELAAVSLAVSIFNVTGNAVILGLGTACDTLFAQAFGGKNKYQMGIQLQRSMFIILISCCPCIGLHICIEPILLLMHQHPVISQKVGKYLLLTVPGVTFAAIYAILTKFVQSQNKVVPALIIGLFGNGLNALMHYFLLYHAHMGLNGSAISLSTSYFAETVATIAYIYFSNIYKTTFQGYSYEMWHDWYKWYQLAIPGFVMLSMQWWLFEAGTICSGIVGERELAAQSILFNLDSIVFTLLPLGLGIATSIRVGQFLGGGCTVGPRSTVNVSLITIWFVGGVIFAILLGCRDVLPCIFTDDEIVKNMASDAMVPLAAFIFFDASVGVGGGILRGSGLQAVGAVTVFISLYLIAAPIGFPLLFLTKLKLKGLWIGMSMGTMIVSTVYALTAFRIDWNKQVKMALERTKSLMDSDLDTKCNQDKFPFKYQQDMSETKASHGCSKGRFLLFLQRAILIGSLLASLIIAIAARVLINWSEYFGLYCIYQNGSFVHMEQLHVSQKATEFAEANNCTIFVT